jgi:hypothetical protein
MNPNLTPVVLELLILLAAADACEPPLQHEAGGPPLQKFPEQTLILTPLITATHLPPYAGILGATGYCRSGA